MPLRPIPGPGAAVFFPAVCRDCRDEALLGGAIEGGACLMIKEASRRGLRRVIGEEAILRGDVVSLIEREFFRWPE